jgi:hypothetical protein
MRAARLVTRAALAACLSVATSDRAAAQSGQFLFVIEAPSLTVSTAADGTRLLRATRAPITIQPGSIPVLATVTAVLSHPTMLYYPIVMTLDAGVERVVVSDLSRGPRTPGDLQTGAPTPFHRGFARAERSGQIFVTTVLVGTESVPYIAGRLTTIATRPSAGPLYNHVFSFLEPRIDRTIGDTATALRNGALWSYVPNPGVAVPAGNNFNFAFANTAQQATVNFFSVDGQSGAIVSCVGGTRPCFFAGTGTYDGLYGEADALTPAALGVTADSASFTLITQNAISLLQGYGACPPGLPPPPGNLISARNVFSDVQLGWDSVACARRYLVRFFRSDGSTIDQAWDATRLVLTSANPFRIGLFDLTSFAVASVDESGKTGPFSPPHPIPRPTA